MEDTPRTLALVKSVILAGFAAGVAMLVGWRYVAARDVVFPDRAGHAGEWFLYSYRDYRGGPSWWPAIALYPLTGVGIGVVLAALAAACLLVRPVARRATTVVAALAIALTGALTGWVSAHLMAATPPVIDAAAVSTAPPEVIDLRWPAVHGAPPTFDLLPPTPTLVALGTIAALLTNAAMALVASRRTEAFR